jgi:hypothetical protein
MPLRSCQESPGPLYRASLFGGQFVTDKALRDSAEYPGLEQSRRRHRKTQGAGWCRVNRRPMGFDES